MRALVVSATLVILMCFYIQACRETPPAPPQPGTQWVTFNKSNSGLQNNYIHAILTDAEGIMWIATDSGACSYSGRSWFCISDHVSYTVHGATGSNQVSIVTSITESPEHSGLVWQGVLCNNDPRRA
jgi:ligand-binding sensor domain-containing protein